MISDWIGIGIFISGWLLLYYLVVYYYSKWLCIVGGELNDNKQTNVRAYRKSSCIDWWIEFNKTFIEKTYRRYKKCITNMKTK